jgi:hypothetical protein
MEFIGSFPDPVSHSEACLNLFNLQFYFPKWILFPHFGAIL